MKRRKGYSRGSAMLLALVFTAIISLLASTLLLSARSRMVLSRKTIVRQLAQLVTAQAVAELQECLFGQPLPPASVQMPAQAPCTQWSPQSCGGSPCTFTRTTIIQGQAANGLLVSFDVAAVWDSAGGLKVNVTTP